MSRTIQLLRGKIFRPVLIGTTALFFCLGFPQNARAEWISYDLWYADNDDAVDYIEKFIDANDMKSHLAVYVFKDGTVSYKTWHDSNPGPDDPGPPKGDHQSRTALAKQGGGGNWVEEREFWDSPVGQVLSGKGKGPGPVINPSDDDTGGGPGNPSQGKEKLGGPLIIDKTGAIGAGKGGGFQFNAGSPAEQLKKPGGPGGNHGGGGGDDGDDKGSNKPPPGTFFGPADLVDPLGPPIARPAKTGAALGGPDTKSRKGNTALGGPDTKSRKGNTALGGPDTKGAGIALGGPDTKSRKGKAGNTFLPYVEQKSLKKDSGKTKGSERGVIAIIKPGEKTAMGNPGFKGKSNAMQPGLLEDNTGFAAQGPAAMGAPAAARGGHR